MAADSGRAPVCFFNALDPERLHSLFGEIVLHVNTMLTYVVKRAFGNLTDYLAWGIGGAFLGCVVCGLYMAGYYTNYEIASNSNWPPFVSRWHWYIMMRVPKPDPLPWVICACGLGFVGGLFAGPRLGRESIARDIAEPGASPNGGPTRASGDSEASEGPPSVT